MAYFLAVDAGGTITEFVVADEYRELARVRTGTIKLLRAGEEVTARNLQEVLVALEGQSGVSMKSVYRCCIGTSERLFRWWRTGCAPPSRPWLAES